MIARKWRPQSFQQLVGQEHISQTLLNALRSNRLHHALLFTGTRGVGKTSTARILAKSIRCPNAIDFAPCNECDVCKDVTSGSSVDVMEIDGASNNGVDAIRELRDSVAYMPAKSKYKVYIIDEVHMLSSSAFNALLKTLEEPPAHVIFIFATTEANKIPVTVLSRCQRFDFRPIASRKIAEHLKYICEQENIAFEDTALWVLAREAQGSMRDSLSLLDQVISFTNSKLNNDNVLSALGLTDRKLLIDCLAALLERSSSQIIEIVKKLYFSGQDPKVFVQDLIEELRHLLLVKLNPNDLKQIVDLPDSELQNLQTLAKNASEEEIHLLFDMSLKGAADLMRAQDAKVVLEMLLLRMANAPKIHFFFGSEEIPDPVQKKTEFSEPSLNSKAPAEAQATTNVAEKTILVNSEVTETAVEPIPNYTETKEAISSSDNEYTDYNNTISASNNSPETQDDFQEETPSFPRHSYDMAKSLQENWIDLIEFIKIDSAILAAKLEHASVNKLELGVLHLSFPKTHAFLAQQWSDSANKQRLLTELQEHWAQLKAIDISLVNTNEMPSLNPMQLKMNEKKKAEQELMDLIHNHHMIQQVQNIFNANIKEIKELK